MSIHDGHRARTREEFFARPDSFPDHRALEVLLYYVIPRGDTNPVAHNLMDRFGSLAGVLDASPKELVKVPGVGEQTASLLKVVKELSGRYVKARSDWSNIINSSTDACAALRPYFYGATQEKVFLLCMDGKNKLLGVRHISDGSVNAAEIATRGVAEAALSLNASRVILAHNHVSGLAFPSQEDWQTSTYLAHVLGAMGIELWDHMILADDDAVSLRDSGFNFRTGKYDKGAAPASGKQPVPER